jgi:hypothetical protein
MKALQHRWWVPYPTIGKTMGGAAGFDILLVAMRIRNIPSLCGGRNGKRKASRYRQP